MNPRWEERNIVSLKTGDLQSPRLHIETKEDFLLLQESARKENLELAVASGYRDYRRQLDIWNGKASGKIPLRNEKGEIIPTKKLSQEKLALTILRWSALPGFSRHHWGSDLDVFDATACPHPQLLPREYQPDGPCHPLFLFLCKEMRRFGFFHPYDRDRGGVCPEPWHISHKKTAAPLQNQLTPEGMKDFIAQRRDEILLADAILKRAELIFKRFIIV